MGSKTETMRAFKTHLDVTGRVCQELNTDKGTEFTSAEFQRPYRRRASTTGSRSL